MSEGHIKNAMLKAAGKGIETKGNTLKILDAVKLYLVRNLAHSPETHKSGTMGIYPIEDGDTNVPTPDGMPDLSNYKYHYKRSTIREGYVYLFKEQKIDGKERKRFYEYEVSEEGDFTMLQWEDPKNSKISWSNPKESTTGDYILLKQSQDVKLWVAFSAFRWSEEYARSMLNENDSSKREKRMQVVDCEQCFKGTFTQDSFKVGDEKLMFTSYFENTIKGYIPNSESDFLKWSSPNDQAKFDRKCEKIKKAQKENELDPAKGDFYFVVSDTLGIADDLCHDLVIERTMHEAMISRLKDNRSLIDEYHHLVGTSKGDDTIDEELIALIDFAALLYSSKDDKSGFFKKYSASINLEILKQVLATEPRRKQRKRIDNIRFALSEVISSEAYQKAMIDFDTDDVESNVNGKTELGDHLIQMNLDPHYSDAYLGMDKEITPNENILEVVEKISSTESITGNLLRRKWDIDAIGASVGLVNKTASALDTILIAFNDMLKKDHQLTFSAEIFKFCKDKDGKPFVKILQSEVDESVREMLNRKKAKTCSIKGKGAAYRIEMKDVTKIEGGDGADIASSSTTKQLNAGTKMSGTVDDITPKWKAWFIGSNSKQLEKNITTFLNNPSFSRFMIGITFINTAIAINDLSTKDDKARNIINLAAASSELLYMGMKYEKVSKMVAKLSLNIGRATVEKFALGAGAFVSFLDARACFSKDEYTASALYAVSTGATIALAVFSAKAAIVVIPLVAIALASGFLADYLRLTATEELIKNSVFGKNHEFEISNNYPQRELLVLAKAKAEVKIKKFWGDDEDWQFKKYVADQRVVLNEFAFLHRGVVGATATIYFNEGDTGMVYTQVIRKSSNIGYIDIALKIGYMPFLQGAVDISLQYISKIDNTNFEAYKFTPLEETKVDLEKGLITVKFMTDSNFDRSDGYLALMFRTCDSLDGQEIFAPQAIDGEKNYFIMYFSSRGKSVTLNPNDPNVGQTHSANFKNGRMYDVRAAEHVEIARFSEYETIKRY